MSTKIEGGMSPVTRTADLATTAAPSRAGGDRSKPVAAAAETDSLRLTGEATGLKAMERELAAPAGIDVAKVNEVRAALSEGRYQVNPQAIANKMLAFERELMG